eukprot:NODE_6694_length_825_cov_48.876068_g6458_i0.p1 GENE.NODE_6694_length_825_cov_48.876068_g6458_i0~~NODE_6694_length_825_cov_48.876068_g6458_i0.p1  ORF type:complete len:180 (-),score=43.21 NODE_6694_length_825_cov_48.876068_g6458_i0:210-749(-)
MYSSFPAASITAPAFGAPTFGGSSTGYPSTAYATPGSAGPFAPAAPLASSSVYPSTVGAYAPMAPAMYTSPATVAPTPSMYAPLQTFAAPSIPRAEPTITEYQPGVGQEPIASVLEGIYQKVDIVGNQLCAFAAELEELKVEISNCNTNTERDIRSKLQNANDEIYQLRNQLSEVAARN